MVPRWNVQRRYGFCSDMNEILCEFHEHTSSNTIMFKKIITTNTCEMRKVWVNKRERGHDPMVTHDNSFPIQQ
jgi:hypothetical protein